MLAEKFEKIGLSDEIDEKLGFARVQEGPRKDGWLINMHPVSYFCCAVIDVFLRCFVV